MSLRLLAAAAVVALVLGLAAAWPFWIRRVRDEIGSIVGAAIVLTATVGFIAREFGDVLETTRRCVAAEVPCRFSPEPFTRYAIHAGIGLLQVFLLFWVGLRVEERSGRRLSP